MHAIRFLTSILFSTTPNGCSSDTMITRITPETLPELLSGIKGIIDTTDLFPSDTLDDMVQLDKEDEVWFVKVVDEVPVAVAYCKAEPLTDGTWNALLLAASPRGRGHGGDMMAHIENDIDGVRLLLVDTSGAEAYAETRKFYEKIGYEQEARIRDYYEDGDDKITYRKKL